MRLNSIRCLLTFAGLAYCFLPHSVSAQSATCDAVAVFEAVRHATGDARWSTLKEIVADGAIVDGDATGTFYTARDIASGRNAFAESTGEGRVAYFYDGRTIWEREQSGGIHAIDAADSRARAITTAYVARNGMWNGAHDPAVMQCTRTGAVDVVRVLPTRGNPIEMHVDRATHLITRIVAQLPTTTSTTDYADYRETGGLALPYVVVQRSIDAFGNLRTVTQTIVHYRLLPAVNAADFMRPADPADARIIGGAVSATVPFAVERGVIVFSATLDGHGPFAFAFDPGARSTITRVASRELGLRPGTMSSVARVRIGGVEIEHLALAVYGGEPADIFRRDARRTPIAGALGPELLDRFAIRIDYMRRTMTFTPLTRFHYGGRGRALVMTMQEDDETPLVAAAIDGYTGLLQYDVRAPSSLVLFAPFLERTGLAKRYHAARGTVSQLVLAGKDRRQVPTRFLSLRTGKFGSRTEAGVAGYGVLSRYVTTLDYRHRIIYFENAVTSR
jgi:hypothetical protein